MKEQKNMDGPERTAGHRLSFWMDDFKSIHTHRLSENLKTDVVIVGGGLAGLTVAYCLSQSGKAVVLVEDGNLGSGETGRTTAHLVTALDDRYFELENIFGEENTRLIADSHRAAIDFVEQTIKAEQIDCDFERVPGYLFLHPTDKEESFQKELEAAQKAGLAIKQEMHTPGMLIEEKSICFLNQAQFHPMKYLDGLRKAIQKYGGKIFTETHAEEINHEGITTRDGFTVQANHVVVATNSPVNNLFIPFNKQYAYRTYVIGALIEKGSVPHALWWDTGDHKSNPRLPPYHYVRVQSYSAKHDLLISGGEDHPTGAPEIDGVEPDRYANLEQWTKKHFPIGEVVYRWSGQVMEPMDGIAFIGRNPMDRDNVYIVTGDSGNGMTHCSMAGILIRDLIQGKENPWEKLYRPSRLKLKESGPMFKQMFHEFLGYLKQMPNFKSTEELESIKPGEGRVVEMLEEKFGVYRDEDGWLHIVSAECTHLKCTVAWNADEKSWDCPCHGSRFTHEGQVINGPANFDLPSYSEVELTESVDKS